MKQNSRKIIEIKDMKVPKRLRWIFPAKKKQKKIYVKQKLEKVFMLSSPHKKNQEKNQRFQKTVQYLQRGTNLDFQKDGSFQQAVGSVLAVAQVFAIMPLRGVTSNNVADLTFSWKYVRTVYMCMVIALSSVNLIFQILFLTYGDIKFHRLAPLVFYGSNTYALVFFCQLAQKWPAIMKQWVAVEEQLPQLKSQFEKQRLHKHIKMISIIILTLSLTENLLSNISGIQKANSCMKTSDPIKNVFMEQFQSIFYFVNYSPTKALFGKFVNVVATFTWTYMDLFIMIISVGLVSRFQQINNSLMEHKGQAMPVSFWTQHRVYYRNICDLCETIDKEIGKITLVAFSNNLWFICVQLLLSLNEKASVTHAVYFWYSLIFLIIRTLALTLYAAGINDESKMPLKVFRSVPRESWCVELKRFSTEVTRDIVALSGMRYFYLTRTLVLSVAATIITYELVLVQFDTEGPSYECTA